MHLTHTYTHTTHIPYILYTHHTFTTQTSHTIYIHTRMQHTIYHTPHSHRRQSIHTAPNTPQICTTHTYRIIHLPHTIYTYHTNHMQTHTNTTQTHKYTPYTYKHKYTPKHTNTQIHLPPKNTCPPPHTRHTHTPGVMKILDKPLRTFIFFNSM